MWAMTQLLPIWGLSREKIKQYAMTSTDKSPSLIYHHNSNRYIKRTFAAASMSPIDSAPNNQSGSPMQINNTDIIHFIMWLVGWFDVTRNWTAMLTQMKWDNKQKQLLPKWRSVSVSNCVRQYVNGSLEAGYSKISCYGSECSSSGLNMSLFNNNKVNKGLII